MPGPQRSRQPSGDSNRVPRFRRAAALAREKGTLLTDAPRRVALVYPAPYRVAGSSLGLQVVYRSFNVPGRLSCERVVAPEPGAGPTSLERGSDLRSFDAVAVSIAFELEVGTLAAMLLASGIPPLRERRTAEDPSVLCGGPLTRSNARLLARLADVIVVGDAEDALPGIAHALAEAASTAELADMVRGLPGVWLPAEEGSEPAVHACGAWALPAIGQTASPDAELKDMFLVEMSRGCPRACTFCVTRRGTATFRKAEADKVVAAVPQWASRVGLIGSAVSDTPGLEHAVTALADSGREVGVSSLRADRLTASLAASLARAGCRTLTLALDAASEPLRASLYKDVTGAQVLRAAEMARDAGMRAIKLYAMVGVPGERDEDMEELCRLCLDASRALPVRLAVGALVPKRHTPLADTRFAGVEVAARRMGLLRSKLRGRVTVRDASARWSEIEWWLSQCGPEGWDCAVRAVIEGGGLGAWRRNLGARFAREG